MNKGECFNLEFVLILNKFKHIIFTNEKPSIFEEELGRYLAEYLRQRDICDGTYLCQCVVIVNNWNVNFTSCNVTKYQNFRNGITKKEKKYEKI